MLVLAPSLCCIFNTSISQCRFPKSWKIERVSPIHKDSSTEGRSSYTPISLLPVVSRLFQIICDQVFTYVTKKDFFYSEQLGFRQFHSVLTCLIKWTNDWNLNSDKGNFSGVIFMDLKKPSIRLYMIEDVELDLL